MHMLYSTDRPLLFSTPHTTVLKVVCTSATRVSTSLVNLASSSAGTWSNKRMHAQACPTRRADDCTCRLYARKCPEEVEGVVILVVYRAEVWVGYHAEWLAATATHHHTLLEGGWVGGGRACGGCKATWL